MSMPVTISHMTADLGTLGVTLLSFDQNFSSFVVPASGTANSGNIPNTTLALGPLAIAEFLLLRNIDIIKALVTVQ